MSVAFKTLGAATLFLDAYLILSMLALERMSRRYHGWLPPLGWQSLAEVPRLVILSIVLWTGLLAIGCLSQRRRF